MKATAIVRPGLDRAERRAVRACVGDDPALAAMHDALPEMDRLLFDGAHLDRSDVVAYALAAGADPDVALDVRSIGYETAETKEDIDLLTPMHEAADMDTIAALLLGGVDPYRTSRISANEVLLGGRRAWRTPYAGRDPVAMTLSVGWDVAHGGDADAADAAWTARCGPGPIGRLLWGMGLAPRTRLSPRDVFAAHPEARATLADAFARRQPVGLLAGLAWLSRDGGRSGTPAA